MSTKIPPDWAEKVTKKPALISVPFHGMDRVDYVGYLPVGSC